MKIRRVAGCYPAPRTGDYRSFADNSSTVPVRRLLFNAELWRPIGRRKLVAAQVSCLRGDLLSWLNSPSMTGDGDAIFTTSAFHWRPIGALATDRAGICNCEARIVMGSRTRKDAASKREVHTVAASGLLGTAFMFVCVTIQQFVPL